MGLLRSSGIPAMHTGADRVPSGAEGFIVEVIRPFYPAGLDLVVAIL